MTLNPSWKLWLASKIADENDTPRRDDCGGTNIVVPMLTELEYGMIVGEPLTCLCWLEYGEI